MIVDCQPLHAPRLLGRRAACGKGYAQAGDIAQESKTEVDRYNLEFERVKVNAELEDSGVPVTAMMYFIVCAHLG